MRALEVCCWRFVSLQTAGVAPTCRLLISRLDGLKINAKGAFELPDCSCIDCKAFKLQAFDLAKLSGKLHQKRMW